MKVILKQDIDTLGESGEVVDVKPGYARNYLLPQGLAYEASEANLKRLEEEQQKAEEKARRDYLEARRRAAQLEEVVVTFEVRASDEGKLFGSVTTADIADEVNKQNVDFELDRKLIQLDEPLKSLGVFNVPVRMHADVSVEIEVRVERGED